MESPTAALQEPEPELLYPKETVDETEEPDQEAEDETDDCNISSSADLQGCNEIAVALSTSQVVSRGAEAEVLKRPLALPVVRRRAFLPGDAWRVFKRRWRLIIVRLVEMARARDTAKADQELLVADSPDIIACRGDADSDTLGLAVDAWQIVDSEGVVEAEEITVEEVGSRSVERGIPGPVIPPGSPGYPWDTLGHPWRSPRVPRVNFGEPLEYPGVPRGYPYPRYCRHTPRGPGGRPPGHEREPPGTRRASTGTGGTRESLRLPHFVMVLNHYF